MPALNGLTVIFDLDGTLADTAPDLVRALNEVVRADGFPETPIEDVRHMVGRGSRALLRRAYARCGAALPEPVIDRRVEAFLASYERAIAEQSRLFDGAVEAMDALNADGARLVIATNKPQKLSDLLMAKLGVAARFEAIIGADAAPKKKPDKAHLIAAVGPGDPQNSVMVGDSDVDVAAARALGIPVIVMAHGYSETPAERLGADLVLSGLAALPEAIRSLAGARADHA